jgi:galactose mutarotase-like enzyme
VAFFQRSRPASPAPRLEDFGFAELRGGGARVLIVPALGGKIAQLELGGRQWLWASDVTPYSLPDDNASYDETADTGGYDECFPTVRACRVPTWVRSFGGAALPDRGELWSQAPAIDVRTSPEGQTATTTWTGRRMPYRFTREVRVTPTGEVTCDYEAANTGADRIPFIWSPRLMLPLTSTTRLDLPPATRMHVYAQHEIALGVGATDLRWPMVRSAGKLLDMSSPWMVAKRYACKLFLEMREGRAAVIQDGVRLDVSFSIEDVPHFGVWINRGAWTPFKRGKAYSNIAFAPCIGSPDTLEEALGAWKSASWLEPGKSRRWSLTWRARAELPPDEAKS